MPRSKSVSPNPIDRLAAWPSPRAWGWLLLAVLILGGYAAYKLMDPLMPFLVAAVLAYACSPLVDRLERHGWTRSAAVTGLLGAIVLVGVLALALLVPPLVADAKDMAHRFPEYAHAAFDRLLLSGQALGLELPDREALLQMVHDRFVDMRDSFFKGDLALPQTWVDSLQGFFANVLSLLLVPVFFYFLLRDLPLFRHQALQLVPPRHRPAALHLYAKVDDAFSGYIRGQLIVATLLAIVFALGLSVLGIRYGLLIGILAGFLNIVPYVGQITGLLLALMMAFVDFQGWGRVLALPLFFGTVNFLEGTFVTPRIVGDKVGLTPLQSLLALLVGGSLLGFVGLLIAIPVAGVAKTLFKEMRQLYFASKLYQGSAAKKKR